MAGRVAVAGVPTKAAGRPGEIFPGKIGDFRPDVASRPRPLFGGKQMGLEWDMPSGYRVQGHPAHAPNFPGEPYAHFKVYESVSRGGRVHWNLIDTFRAGVDQVPWWLW